MKMEFTENKYMANITLTPETPDEFAQLARLSKNAKQQPPDIHLSFEDSPVCYLTLKKLQENLQQNYINNKKRK